VYPPLRTKSVTNQLKQAVLDGTIDCIASHHLPHEYDSKILEFENAKYGMTGLETAYAAVQTLFPDLPAEKVYALFGANARNIFNLEPATIEKDKAASLTLFDQKASWTYDLTKTASKSRNSAFHGQVFKGKVTGTFTKGKLHLNS
jgi:dihydroorotase